MSGRLFRDLQQAVQRAVELLRRARYVTCLVGAGLSVESGIPPFRGPGGLWTKYGEPPPNEYERILADPKRYWEERLNPTGARAELYEALRRARPNPGHHALADLERMGVLRFTITQNVDGLERQAGCTRLVEIHGSNAFYRCIGCGARFLREEFPIREIPPSCPHCGGLVKFDVVHFGEPIPGEWLARCAEETARSDCMLLVGTSGQVYPAAMYPQQIKARGGVLIEVNPLETALTDLCDAVLRAPAGTALPLLVQALREARG